MKKLTAAERAKRLEENLLKCWDARVVQYDANQFPFHKWILERVNKRGWELDDLQYLHKAIPTGEVYKVTKELCADTGMPEFRKMLNRFVKEVIAIKGEMEPPLAVQRFVNVRVMLPNKPLGIFPFHTGILYGHGLGSRSLWMPLTDVSSDEMRNASMQIMGIKRSRELVAYARDNKLTSSQMSELFGKESVQCKCCPGSLIFFSQENIHGNFLNDTGKTRVSIDFRVAEGSSGDMLARKIPGGYFEIIPDDFDAVMVRKERRKAAFHNGKSNVLYLNNATAGTEGAPVHLQRYMVYEYVQKHNLNYEFELFELEEMRYLPTLRHIAHDLKCNCVLYSVFALPEDHKFRKEVLDHALANNLVFHFVNEDMAITCKEDREDVERLLDFARYSERADAQRMAAEARTH